ncbi:hypothetical protein GWD52_08530 [Enterobacteriaceae bacterium 4M9]|nr:hypothetical protein [Enterobacteriaceae bacterium 4M9]
MKELNNEQVKKISGGSADKFWTAVGYAFGVNQAMRQATSNVILNPYYRITPITSK